MKSKKRILHCILANILQTCDALFNLKDDLRNQIFIEGVKGNE